MTSTTGCLTKREVQYARATKLPSEVKGFMRLAQDKVKVQVINGDGYLGEFSTTEKSFFPEQKHLSSYLLLHERDVASFVKSQKVLNALLKDPVLAKQIEKLLKETKAFNFEGSP